MITYLAYKMSLLPSINMLTDAHTFIGELLNQ